MCGLTIGQLTRPIGHMLHRQYLPGTSLKNSMKFVWEISPRAENDLLLSFFLVLWQTFFLSNLLVKLDMFLCVNIYIYPGEVHMFLFLRLTCCTWLKQPWNLASKHFWKFGMSLVAI